jgi:crotonobetainyl-CoA:carnitine CoA-transferase CaiB-like acyl-CoA transferase
MWTRLVTLMDDPAWTDDPRFASRSTISRSHADEAYDLMTAWSRRHTKEELLGLGIEHHIPIAPVRGLDEVLTDEHLRARGAFIELDRPHVGRLTHVGAPIEGTLSWTVDRPAPTLGQHDDHVGAELDASRDADPGPSLPGRPATVPSAEGPLAGIRVIDFGHILAGPLVGGYLSDLGAEVIRVESRSHLDVMRTRVIVGRPLTDDPTLATDASIQFQGLNRGKSSITVNFKDPRGRALVLRLVAASDLVIDNFSAGVLDRVGLGYDDLRAVKPDVIQLSLSGAGQSGPLARMVAYAPIMTAMSGHSSLAGHPGERPLNIGPFGDSVAAAHALMALLVAILARRRTGRGQRIDLSAYGAATSLLGPSLVRHQLTGEVPGTLGNSHPDLAPHGIYRCRDGLDREHFVAIVVTDDAGWSTLASVASRGWASDRRFVDHATRLANRSELDAAIADWARIQERDVLVDALQSGGVAATPVCDIDEMAADPHWQARGTFTSVRHPVFGDLPVARLPWQFGRSRVGPRVAASALGADTDRICTELLGMTQAEVDEMRSALA